MDSVFDSWGEYNRECTSAVAWWLHERNGFEMPFHDNASGWGPDARARGFAVNGTPAVGSVAWWGAGDHVAWVAAVSGGSVRIEEYNYGYQGHYHERTIPASAPSGYIHFKDLTTAPSWPPAEGSFVSYGGTVYRIAGGAPLAVSSWSVFGGPQPTMALTTAQWHSLRRYPADGTFIQPMTGNRTVYVVAGGAPLAVSSWSHVGGSAGKTVVGVDEWAVAHLNHLNAVPADGTFIQPMTGNRTVYVVAGGAPLAVSSWSHVGGSAGKTVVGVDEWAVAHLNHLNAVPADGTFIQPMTGNRTVYVVAGGAPLAVSSWSHVGGSAGKTVVGVDEWAVAHLNHLNAVPADGTFIQPMTGNRTVYVVAGGAPLAVSSWSHVGGSAGKTVVGVDEWAVAHLNHLNAVPADGTFIQPMTGNRTVYVVAGGAPIGIYSSAACQLLGCQPIGIDEWAVAHLNHLNAVPVDGTVLRGVQTGNLYRVSGGIPSPVSSTGSQAPVDVDQAAIDHAGDGLSHLLAPPRSSPSEGLDGATEEPGTRRSSSPPIKTVRAARSATVKHGKALVKLTCIGPGICKGSLKLVARVIARRAAKRRRGKRHPRKRARTVVIGQTRFSITEGKSETMNVHLSAEGRALVRKVGKRGLKVTVEWDHIKTGTLRLNVRNVRYRPPRVGQGG